jgi:predicted  nucleic acid-binding Zn-ribbon protein
MQSTSPQEVRMKKRFLLLGLFCLFSAAAVASDDAELRRLQSILATLNQQLEATYRQFQMVQQARRDVLQTIYFVRPGLDPRSYDEITEAQTQAMRQEKELTEQMHRLLAKAREIEAQMNPVLERIYQFIPASADTGQPAQSQAPPAN